MDTISMDRIRKRITSLTCSEVKKFNLNPVTVFEQAMQSCSDSILENAIYNWEGLSLNKDIAFTQVMQLFDKICENGNVGLIRKTCNFICEEVVNKVSDTNKMHSYIDKKMKERDIHTSSNTNSFVDKKLQQAKDVKNAVVSVATAAKDNFKKNTSQIKQNIDKSLGRDKNKDKDKKNEIKKESYQNILDTIDMYSNCDRVLENYNKLSKRFNIDKLIEDYSNLSISTIVYEICSLIDTYRIPFKAKYNIALETAFYSMKKHSIMCELSDLAKATTDYFLVNYSSDLDGDSLSEKCINTISAMKYVLEKNNFYDKELDFNKIDFIFDKPTTNDFISESKYIDMISEQLKANTIINLINDFKQSKFKNKEAIEDLVAKIYGQSDEDILDNTPNFLELIRLLTIYSTFSINPYLGAIIMFADLFIKRKISKKQAIRMVECYENERNEAYKRLNTLKSEDAKNRAKEYISTLDSALIRLKRHRNRLLSDKELDAIEYVKENDNGIIERSVEYITTMENDLQYLKDTDLDIILDDIRSNIDKIDYDDIDAITDFAVKEASIISPNKLLSILKEEKKHILKDRSTELMAKDYMRIDCLQENIDKLLNPNNNTLIIAEDDTEGIYNNLRAKVEFVKALKESLSLYSSIKNTNSIMEASILNSLKLAGIKLKKSVKSLSDKEKAISRNMDTAINKISDGVKKALSDGNREAIIRGSIIPSASRAFKGALAAGATTVFINPVVAIIGVLGSLAASKVMQNKERQLVLDEIEIELKITEKYIKIAEEKEDMEALRNLLSTQRNLERQRQRIKYKINVIGRKDVPNVASYNYTSSTSDD